MNPSLQKKSAARMSAVQCIYRESMSEDKLSTEEQIDSLKKQLKGNRKEQKLMVGAPVEPNYPLLAAILEGRSEREEDIDKRLDSQLTDSWKRERMPTLLLAILQCAIFEMFFHKDNKHGVIIDEYTRLTRHFFASGEVDFVFGALTRLAQKYDG